MKKIVFATLVLTLVFGFMVGVGIQTGMAAEKAKYGGILRFNHSKPAGIIGNPLLIRGWNHEFIDFCLQTLIVPSNTKLGTFEPQLATSWELAPDKSSYTFKLRKGVKFHDGTDFNAQAVKWNLDMWVKSKRPRLDKVTSIDVIDDYTVRFNLSGWDSVSLFDFAKDTFIVSPTAWQKNGDEWVKYNPVGTGAFKLVEFKRNVSLKYEKNKHYWKEGLPYLDGLFITQIGDPMTAIASLKKGEIDAWLGVDPITGSELKKEGKWVISTNPGPHEAIFFNSENPSSIWSDKRMREALEYGIDKASIAKAIGRGFYFPIYEIVHSIPAKAGTTPRRYDPEKAKQLLKEAGHPSLKVKLSYMAGPQQSDFVAIQGNLSKIGITLEPEALMGPAYHKKQFEPVVGDNLVLAMQRGGPNELLVSVDETLAPGTVFFKGVKRPAGFEDLLNSALREPEMGKALSTLYKMEKLAYDDAMFIPLWGVLFIAVDAPYVKGTVWFWGSMPYPNLESAWLDK